MGENVRSVTLTISSTCNSPEGHQAGYIQISAMDTWIPPEPLGFPLPGGGGPDTELQALAEALRTAMRAAEQVKGSGIGYVGEVTNPGPDKDGARRQITFAARDEVNIGVCKDKNTPTVPQINLGVEVDFEDVDDPGDEEDPTFDVKLISPLVLWGSTPGERRRRRVQAGAKLEAGVIPSRPTPRQTPHKVIRLRPNRDADVRTNRRPKRSKHTKKGTDWYVAAPQWDGQVIEKGPPGGEDSKGCILGPSASERDYAVVALWGLFTEDYEPELLTWEPLNAAGTTASNGPSVRISGSTLSIPPGLEGAPLDLFRRLGRFATRFEGVDRLLRVPAEQSDFVARQVGHIGLPGGAPDFLSVRDGDLDRPVRS